MKEAVLLILNYENTREMDTQVFEHEGGMRAERRVGLLAVYTSGQCVHRCLVDY